MTKTEAPTTLDELRDEIDRIDRDLHTRLIERGDIIDRLIAVKAAHPGTSAFRPAREADMMRRLVKRHRGILPTATVESIWRIIISTFTYVQAPYTVHADIAAGDPAMRDSARFHFGFTVPLATHHGSDRVIAAVARADGDLGLVRADNQQNLWWHALTPPSAPKIIARLPFVERSDHAAGLPIFIVAKPLEDGAPRDVLLYDVTGAIAGQPDQRVEVVADAGSSLLVAVPGSMDKKAVAETFGVSDQQVAFIGSHAARFEIES
jgi:chorismate mutase